MHIGYLLLFLYLGVDLLPVEGGQLFGYFRFQLIEGAFIVFQVMLDALPVDLLHRSFCLAEGFTGLLFGPGFSLYAGHAAIGHKMI